MTSQPAIVFASFTPHPDRTAELREVLDTMVEHTRQESGCEFYDLYVSDGGSKFHLFERYEDEAALEAHRASDHYLAYRAKLPDLVRDPIEVSLLSELDVD